MVASGSRKLSPAETRYATIELECLSSAWAMYKCRIFLEGLSTFQLVTDHKPLVPILNDYSLDKLDNPRPLRRFVKMQRFSSTATWVAGKKHLDADALSRSPVDDAGASDELAEGLMSFTARQAVILVIGGSDERLVDPILAKVKEAAANDPVMQELRVMSLQGFPNSKCNLSEAMRPF